MTNFSFEFFPTTTTKSTLQLQKTVDHLSKFSPKFISVTYGANGSDQNKTIDTINNLRKNGSLEVVPHLTCVGQDKDVIHSIADNYWNSGITRIVALRGDSTADSTTDSTANSTEGYVPHPTGYAYAVDLVSALKARHDFDLTVAAYPEVHPEAPSADFDLNNLKQKFDAGADSAITQFFFNNEAFLRFRDRATKAGIDKPIIPGLLPITNFSQVKKFSKACAASIPQRIHKLYEGTDDEPLTQKLLASNIMLEQVQHLQKEGVDDFHFYTLNRSEVSYAVCQWLEAS